MSLEQEVAQLIDENTMAISVVQMQEIPFKTCNSKALLHPLSQITDIIKVVVKTNRAVKGF